ncbi:hypothetical protein EIP91_000707 [Steccherinum ochraceum]|uniref:Uncharacterized protein n=1 Tax=Steccherinum ochraceum TaxID=92696 RepID=A0A4R0RNR8_9APHY|nr:hypothetical protein EIP91_000707 [Steccherinum ochraceum]
MPASPTYPTRPHRTATHAIPGFISPRKPKQRPINDLTIPELSEKHARNKRILSNPGPSTSVYVQRLSAEQVAIEARLAELVGVEKIQEMLERTTISDDNGMKVDGESEPQAHDDRLEAPVISRRLETKQRILNSYGASIAKDSNVNTFSFEEAARIEKEAHAQDERRRQEAEERKRRRGLPIKGEVLTEKERAARIWAFMNYKPTESDLEDDDDDDKDSDDDDPAAWFDDDQDDGRKGQDIVEPDDHDFSTIIRVDEAHIPRSMLYEPRDDE